MVAQSIPMQQPSKQESGAILHTDTEETNPIIQRINQDWTRAENSRKIQENRVFMRALFNTKAYYMPRTGEDGNLISTSQAFVSITRPKIQTAVSLLVPTVMPGGDTFTVSSDPDSVDPKIAYSMLKAGASPSEIRDAMRNRADVKADRLSGKIHKGLDYSKFADKMLSCMYDMCMFGTGIIVGPFPVANPEASVDVEVDDQNPFDVIRQKFGRMVGLGTANPVDELFRAGLIDKYLPYVDVISPLCFYPDPMATKVENMRYFIDRQVLSKPQVQEMLNDPSFRKEDVQKVLDTYPDGVYAPTTWEAMLNSLNSQPMLTAPSGRFICHKWYGFMTGKDLKEGGIKIPEGQLDQRAVVECWKIGNRLVKLVVSSFHKDRLPVYVCPYSYTPNSIWGVGVAELMFDSQDGANAAERQLMDNLAAISGPMLGVDVDQLADPSEALAIGPKRIFRLKPALAGATRSAIEAFAIPVHIQEILAVQQNEERLAQEQTGLPNFLAGQAGPGNHNRTAEGANLQYNNALTPLKTVVNNIEQNLMGPLIKSLVAFYQTYSNDPDIKGKFIVSCNGLKGLMARESMLSSITDTFQAIGQIPNSSDWLNMDRILNSMFRTAGFITEDFVKDQATVQQEREDRMKAEQENKAFQAGLEAAPKMRAEMSPREALMELVKESPDDTLFRIALMEKAVLEYGLDTPEIQQAVEVEKEKLHIQDESRAFEAGAAQADRHLAPVPHPMGGKWQEAMQAEAAGQGQGMA